MIFRRSKKVNYAGTRQKTKDKAKWDRQGGQKRANSTFKLWAVVKKQLHPYLNGLRGAERDCTHGNIQKCTAFASHTTAYTRSVTYTTSHISPVRLKSRAGYNTNHMIRITHAF